MVQWMTNYFDLQKQWHKSNQSYAAYAKLCAWQTEEQMQDMFVYLACLAMNVFKWEGLPGTCNERALEHTLFFDGRALFFRDDDPGGDNVKLIEGADAYWHSSVTLGPGYNLYNEHTERTAYGPPNYHKPFDITNSVLIRNNAMMFPTYHTVSIYAEKLVHAARTIDNAARNLEQPYVVTAGEDQLSSWDNFLASRRNHEPAIILAKNSGMDQELPKVFPVSAGQSKVMTDLWTHKHNEVDEIMTRLGIKNANTDKKERLITDEVAANDGQIEQSVGTMLRFREDACEAINKMFGLAISVKMRYNGGGENEVEPSPDDQPID